MAQSGTLNTGTFNNSNFFVDWSFARNNGRIATLNFTIGLNMTQYAWWGSNAVIINEVYIAGKRVTEGGTFSNLSGNPNNRQALINGSVDLNVDSSGNANFNINFYGKLYNTGSSYVDMNKDGSFSLSGVVVTPTVDLSEVSKTATSITVKATSNNGITPTKYYFTCGNSTKETTSNQVTFDNLTPNTPYTIKCKGYANNDYGVETTKIITTNRQNSISNIGDFTLDGVTFTITGNPNDKSTIKILVGNTVVATRTNVGVGQYTLTLTDAEKETIYRLMGNNSSIGAVIRIDTGGATLDYNKNITLTGDVFSCSINVGGTIKKGKVWVGTPSGNKQGIFTIGTSNGNKRGR